MLKKTQKRTQFGTRVLSERRLSVHTLLVCAHTEKPITAHKYHIKFSFVACWFRTVPCADICIYIYCTAQCLVCVGHGTWENFLIPNANLVASNTHSLPENGSISESLMETFIRFVFMFIFLMIPYIHLVKLEMKINDFDI